MSIEIVGGILYVFLAIGVLFILLHVNKNI